MTEKRWDPNDYSKRFVPSDFDCVKTARGFHYELNGRDGRGVNEINFFEPAIGISISDYDIGRFRNTNRSGDMNLLKFHITLEGR